MAQIKLTDVGKRFRQNWVIRHFNLDVEDREFIVLVGPSGCGKSTTLRMIAGLEETNEGQIIIGDRVVNDVAPKDRDIAMVFQSYALYPHMSVFDNMAFGLQNRGFDKSEIANRVNSAAEILGIGELLNRKPKQLSGGQRQRVAMGRAIVRDPQAFLFDEPLSNLDAKLRVLMRAELKKLHQRLRATTVYVTHDQVEAMTLADRIVIMNEGRIMQVGRPLEVYEKPRNRFVAGFIGSPAMNFLDVRLVETDGAPAIDGQSFLLSVPDPLRDRCRSHLGRRVIFGIRPENVTQRPSAGDLPPGTRILKALVDIREPLGAEIILIVTTGDHRLTARVSPEVDIRVGETIELALDLNKMHLFDPETGAALGAGGE